MSRPHSRVLVPRPDRIRTLNGIAFGWIDACLWRREWLRTMSCEEIAVYVFLCLVADRQGVSFQRRDRIVYNLDLDVGEVDRALGALRHKELVAFQPFGPHTPDGFHQVLALSPLLPPPPQPTVVRLWRPQSIRALAVMSPWSHPAKTLDAGLEGKAAGAQAFGLEWLPVERLRWPLEPLRGSVTDRAREHGALTDLPVRVVPLEDGHFEVIDGFKRLHRW